MSDLKPCPFCGSEATMYYWRKMGTEFMQWGRVRCTNDYCAMSGVDWSDIRSETRHETNREEDAIKRWNTRAPTAAMTEETASADALQAQLDALMLEYCPDEITPDQWEEWSKHQKQTPEDKP